MNGASVYVAGVGMTKFWKPSESPSYIELGEAAIRDALQDSGLQYSDVQRAYAGYVYGDSGCGQAVLYNVGMTGIPIINTNNNCSTGSSALYLAREAIVSGAVDCALVVGFEQMNPGALTEAFADRVSPFERFIDTANRCQGPHDLPVALQLFGGAGVEYQQKYGISAEVFASISVKARHHAAHNERAIFRAPTTVEEVMASPPMFGCLTRLQCCPPTCGAGAAVLMSEDFARRKGLTPQVRISAQAMSTDKPASFEDSMMRLVGYDMTVAATEQVYQQAGIGPEDIDVIELHDCFTANELITYESLGLTPEGTAEKFISDGDNTYGGQFVVNPSGGLLSKGHPLGATGLAQCAELTWQLRGQAGKRQVEGARIALQHNVGLGGACVVGLYEKV